MSSCPDVEHEKTEDSLSFAMVREWLQSEWLCLHNGIIHARAGRKAPAVTSWPDWHAYFATFEVPLSEQVVCVKVYLCPYVDRDFTDIRREGSVASMIIISCEVYNYIA